MKESNGSSWKVSVAATAAQYHGRCQATFGPIRWWDEKKWVPAAMRNAPRITAAVVYQRTVFCSTEASHHEQRIAGKHMAWRESQVRPLMACHLEDDE